VDGWAWHSRIDSVYSPITNRTENVGSTFPKIPRETTHTTTHGATYGAPWILTTRRNVIGYVETPVHSSTTIGILNPCHTGNAPWILTTRSREAIDYVDAFIHPWKTRILNPCHASETDRDSDRDSDRGTDRGTKGGTHNDDGRHRQDSWQRDSSRRACHRSRYRPNRGGNDG
jgi:hypothetical protein